MGVIHMGAPAACRPMCGPGSRAARQLRTMTVRLTWPSTGFLAFKWPSTGPCLDAADKQQGRFAGHVDDANAFMLFMASFLWESILSLMTR